MVNSNDITPRPYLIAAWPGMGNVAAIASGYLIHQLGLEPMGVVPLIDTFDLNHVGIRGGVVERPHLPRGLLFRTPEDHEGRPLIVFLAEAQPSRKGYAFVHDLLDQLRDENIERVFTFASLASAIHPSEEPGVSAAVTSANLLEELSEFGITPASDGRIGGLNGLLLGAAGERELDGACLLAEIPFYAARVPNYRAARALLGAFGDVSGFEVDFTELNHRVESTEDTMLRLLEQAEATPRLAADGTDAFPRDDEGFEPDDGVDIDDTPPVTDLDPETLAGIEAWFREATEDRRSALGLKEELDRLGVFDEYEDRFLDLFRPSD